MPSLHETANPRIKNNLTQEDLEKIYIPKKEEIQWAFKTARGSVPQLGLLNIA